MANKKKVIEAHGRDEDAPIHPTTLDQLWGGGEEILKYGTLSLAEYEEKLNDMSRPVLEEHARKLGVLVVESTARLRDNLIREFTHFTTSLHRPSPPPAMPADISPEVKRILSEGR